jgi:cbb3-type cytochrome oxidase cytochrome c subunit
MQCCHYGEAARDEAWRGVSRQRRYRDTDHWQCHHLGRPRRKIPDSSVRAANFHHGKLWLAHELARKLQSVNLSG